MNWIDYRDRLGIGLGDHDLLQMCINRIRNLCSEPIIEANYSEDNLFKYANTVGIRYNNINDRRIFLPLDAALNHVFDSRKLNDMISKYIALTNSARDTIVTKKGDHFLSELFESIILSTFAAFRIPYEIVRDEDGFFLFPKGVPEFDRDLVSEPLMWLSQYPETEKAWGKALRAYSKGEDPSEVADLFRKTLERFFQNYFCSDKTLENLKAVYGRYLKDHGIPGEVAANLESLLQQYTNFMNSFAKHHDRTSKLVLEYIMYLTGNIIRLLMKLKEEDNVNGEENNVSLSDSK